MDIVSPPPNKPETPAEKTDLTKQGHRLLIRRTLGALLLAVSLAGAVWLVLKAPHYDIRKYQLAVLAATDLTGFVVGFLFVKNRLQVRVVLIQLMILTLFLELGLTVYDVAVRNKIAKTLPATGADHELGWVAKPNLQVRKFIKGYGLVDYRSTRDGFREFGDPNTHRKKIFVIGDSFTQAEAVSNDQTYFYTIGKHAPETEIFAYGAIGYGSYQEYAILNKYIDEIKPDLILWQFCNNDIINNSAKLSSMTRVNTPQWTMPFYENGAVHMEFPHPLGWLMSRSRLARFFNGQADIFLNAIDGTIENDLTPDHPLFQASAKTTSDIMAMVKKRAESVPVVAFGAYANPSFDAAFERIARENGMDYVPGVQAQLEAARKRGIAIDNQPFDNHWTATGHAMVGETVLKYLRDKGYLGPQTSQKS